MRICREFLNFVRNNTQEPNAGSALVIGSSTDIPHDISFLADHPRSDSSVEERADCRHQHRWSLSRSLYAAQNYAAT